jgi:hypothetical protein
MVRTDVVSTSNVQLNSKVFLKRIKEVALALRAVTVPEKVSYIHICMYIHEKSQIYVNLSIYLCVTHL